MRSLSEGFIGQSRDGCLTHRPGSPKSYRSLLRFAIAAALVLLAAPAGAQQAAFRTDGAATVTLAATATTGRVQIQAAASGTQNARVYNAGTVAVFVECGTVAVLATVAASLPIAPGTVEIIGCNQTHIAGITSTGTATIYVTPGTGL